MISRLLPVPTDNKTLTTVIVGFECELLLCWQYIDSTFILYATNTTQVVRQWIHSQTEDFGLKTKSFGTFYVLFARSNPDLNIQSAIKLQTQMSHQTKMFSLLCITQHKYKSDFEWYCETCTCVPNEIPHCKCTISECRLRQSYAVQFTVGMWAH